jgi:acyl dehydratase
MSVPTEIGAALPPREFGPITTEMFVRYAGSSGDFNPIHYDSRYAAGAGYPGVFSQGMHHAALLATFVTELAGVEAVRRFGVRFRDQVWPGDLLRCAGEVKSVEEHASGAQRVTLVLTMITADGRLVMTGDAEVLLP